MNPELEKIKIEHKKLLELMTQKNPQIIKLQLEIDALRKIQSKVIEDFSEVTAKLRLVDQISKLRKEESGLKQQLIEVSKQKRIMQTLAGKVESIFSEVNTRYASIIKIKKMYKEFEKATKNVNKRMDNIEKDMKKLAHKKDFTKFVTKVNKKLEIFEKKIKKTKKKGIFR